MKKFTITFCLFFLSYLASRGQTFPMYSEDFEIPDSVIDVPAGLTASPGWVDDSLHVSGIHSYHSSISGVGDTNILETTPFSDNGIGLGFITLTFQHIAKVDFFDRCIIQFSTDFGTTWTLLDSNN